MKTLKKTEHKRMPTKTSCAPIPGRYAKGTRIKIQLTTTVWRFGAEEPPLSQIAKVFCGRAFVSVHLCPVSTPSLRSVGHSPQVHGTQAQIYLATSPYLYVVCNKTAQRQKSPQTKSKRQNPQKMNSATSNHPYFRKAFDA